MEEGKQPLSENRLDGQGRSCVMGARAVRDAAVQRVSRIVLNGDWQRAADLSTEGLDREEARRGGWQQGTKEEVRKVKGETSIGPPTVAASSYCPYL